MDKDIKKLIKANELRADLNFSGIGKVERQVDEVQKTTILNTNRVFDVEEDVQKLKQNYFTGGQGIIITDNRSVGMDNVEISVDASIIVQPRIDLLEQQVYELQKTNKALAQYIFDDQKKKGHLSRGGSTNSKPKRIKNRKLL